MEVVAARGATWKDCSTDSYCPSISSPSERPVMVTVGVLPAAALGVEEGLVDFRSERPP